MQGHIRSFLFDIDVYYVHQYSMFNETGTWYEKKNEISTLGPKRPGWSERINDISFNAVLR